MYMYWGATGQVVPEVYGAARRRPLALLVAVGLLAAGVTVAVPWASAPHATHTTGRLTNVAVDVATAGPVVETPTIVKQNRLPPPTVAPPTVASPAVGASTTAAVAPASTGATVAAARPAPTAAPVADGCSAALAYLAAHSAPGFRFECPGFALGHQAMTCVDVAGVCPGSRLIVISDACPAAYMNEAHNSWILTGLAVGRFDPYGYCNN
jgi:hypothetical protein